MHARKGGGLHVQSNTKAFLAPSAGGPLAKHLQDRVGHGIPRAVGLGVGISIYVVHTVPPFYACGPIDKQCVFCYNVPS